MAAPADEVGFFFREHGAHGREGRLHDRLVSVGFEAASPQHRLHGNVDGVAHEHWWRALCPSGRRGFDRAILKHHEFVGAMAHDAVLDFVADDAQVLYMRVVDGKLEG